MWKLFVVISRAIVCSHVWWSWFAASTAAWSARDVRVPDAVCHSDSVPEVMVCSVPMKQEKGMER